MHAPAMCQDSKGHTRQNSLPLSPCCPRKQVEDRRNKKFQVLVRTLKKPIKTDGLKVPGSCVELEQVRDSLSRR